MSDDVFRMIVAVGVAIAALSFVVQAIVGMIVLGVARKVEAKVTALSDRAEPLIDRAGPAIDKVGPAIDKASATIEKAGAAIEKATPLIEQAKPAIAKIEPTIQKIAELIATARETIEETRPQIREVSSQVVEIAKSGRETVEKVGDFVSDASGMAKSRLEQIDATVGSTVETVEQASHNVKRAVTRPVREVNGLAAGVAAAVSTFVKGPRRSSVDSATQDEEMFI
jgi:methyl-accepting chemotaxis protein